MKLPGGVVPLRRRDEETGEPSVVTILAVVAVSELLLVQSLATMVDRERAAFYAARSQRADVSVQQTGA
jgi:hypothetical protein